MSLPLLVTSSDGGIRSAGAPEWTRGRVMVIESDDPKLFTVILHSAAGTTIRNNCELNQSWRTKIKDGHHLIVRLAEIGKEPGPVVAGFRTRPAVLETNHPVDCPPCSGLSRGSLGRAVQNERARAKLAKQEF